MTATPNHALQRTGSAVTAPAADHHHLSTHRQVPRPLRLSLSLGSFGDSSRTLKTTLFVLLFSTLSFVAVADEPPFLGVFSNKAESFNIKTIMLDTNGKGYYFAAVSGIPVLWKHDPTNNQITLSVSAAPGAPAESFAVRFDPVKKEITIIDPQYAERSGPLQYLGREIPQRIRDAIKDFDGTIKRK